MNYKRIHIVFILLFLVNNAFAQLSTASEYQVKSAYIYHFTKFIQWPQITDNSTSPIIIGVLGEDVFGDILDSLVNGEKVSGRPLVVKYFKNLDELTACHLLYINKKDEDKFKDVFNRVRGKQILTIGEGDNFISRGGMIRFHFVASKIHLQINKKALDAENIIISSKLLSLAEIVAAEK